MVATFKVALILGIKDKMKIIKFGIVGFVGFLVNFAFIRLFRGLGFTEVLTWLFATELAIANNYIFNNLWTFKAEKIAGFKAHVNKFFQFNLTSAGALIIQSILGPLGVKLFGTQYDFLVLGVIVLFIVFPYNYIMANIVIWKTWKLGSKKKS
jgi:dolichol-phosphate mannosyltransferase